MTKAVFHNFNGHQKRYLWTKQLFFRIFYEIGSMVSVKSFRQSEFCEEKPVIKEKLAFIYEKRG